MEVGETSFEKLATNYSEGPEQRNGGRVGPTLISRDHPQLQQRLRDDAMRQRMESELLEQWITTETNNLVKAICSRENDL
ncbi:hypothetical protein SynMEDNS5_02713 [Synechococcus sp. MEDNS5]|uniref:hypothetical protein n=1 Tax=Synechococcus sp. MEDNS5 TaxID=1442554 RepID=UPI001861A66B|nr:hypothetical protein [Synechococcus sp. MEDNS5]QNJ07400.1 hypothetical protein SynMEDNS5_02713 [Synechococcus sp. MEDNS5]